MQTSKNYGRGGNNFFIRAVAITEVLKQKTLPPRSQELGTVFKSPALRKPMEFLFSTTSAEAGSSPSLCQLLWP